MNTLKLYDIHDVDKLAWPDRIQVVDAESPALAVLTDFKQQKPLIVNHNMRAVDIPGLMRRQHVRLKLVVDDYEEFLGVVSLDDLQEEEILKKVAFGYDRCELGATDFMKSRHAMKALDIAELEHVRLGDLLHLLRAVREQHCLVVDRQSHCVRGVISASDIARKMKLPLVPGRDASFERVYRATHASG